jgi:anaerobic magnesium-protoporphyrin IX monomethyl ester cyclase
MNVLLISPHLEIKDYGIRMISACLKREEHNVTLVFLPREFSREYEEATLDELVQLSTGCDLIGISVMTNSFNNVAQMTSRLKQSLTVPIIWGGTHATIRPQECLDYADMVCVGEGEVTIVELADRMQSDRPYDNVEGLWLKKGRSVISNKIRPLVQDLDALPFQDYDYSSHYILDGKRIQKMDRSLFIKCSYAHYMTMPTRGCPYGCSYCCNNTFNEMYRGQRILRKRTPGDILVELRQAIGQIPFIERVVFNDDAFLLYSHAELEELCLAYKEHVDLPISLGGGFPSNIDKDKLSLLVEAGLTNFRMGIQTASERTMKLYKRRNTLSQIEAAAGIVNAYRDRIRMPQYDIIVDNPWETDEDIIKTLMFLTRLRPPYELTIFSLTFYPEMELYERAKRDGLIGNENKDIYAKHYHVCNKSYLNRLFFLLNEFAAGGGRIPAGVMSLLTRKKVMQMKLNWILYYLLKLLAVPFRIRRLLSLAKEGWKDIRRGNWNRIKRYILKYA